jgi:lysophospholipase L1-like esterase
VLLALCFAGALLWYTHSAQDVSFWESNIAAFEAEDRASPPTPGDIVFVGSSSIRFWDSLERDFEPLPVVNRGFGGSQLSHAAFYARRILAAHRPRAVVLYAGDNDLADEAGKTPSQVASDFQRFVEAVHGEVPDARIYFLSIKPSKLRWARWLKMQEANAEIEKLCASDPRLRYVDVATAMLGADGLPRGELFRFDGLHLNAEGYALWVSILRPILVADWEGGLASLPR